MPKSLPAVPPIHPTMKIRAGLLAASLVLAASSGLRAQSAAAAPSPTPGYVDAFKPSAADSLPTRQARTATRLGRRMVTGETQLLRSFAALYQEVWQNPDGLTPQQVCDALGTRAGSLFVIAGTMANALYQIDPAGLGAMVSPPAGYTMNPHDDGSVTLTYAAPAAGPTASPTPTATP